MLPRFFGLMASSIIAFVSAEDLQPCGNAFYVASQLCPVVNGQPTQPCGADCYLPTAYSCNNGKLAPPLPSSTENVQLIVLKSPYFDSELVKADGLVFRIGGGPPATYCPDEVSQVSQCPPGSETDFTCDSGYCSLNVEVPGGQQVYVAPNGAVSYTSAHSGIAPPGSSFSGFSLSNDVLSFGNSDFYVCPPVDGTYDPQLYVGYDSIVARTSCYEVEVVTAPGNNTGFSAWQYI
ncbi:hypothetical protein BDR22DRAFT_818450 [Usnea florida]